MTRVKPKPTIERALTDVFMTRIAVLLVLVLGAAPLAAEAQGLAEVAKQEEARRKSVKEPGKVYKNGDLRPDISKSAPAGDAPADAKADAKDKDAKDKDVKDKGSADAGAADKTKKTDEPAKDEAYWRERIGGARAALERSKIFGDALQSRLNALNADFVNRDDPAQRAQIELERKRTASELERVTKEITDGKKAIGDIEEEARKAGVPPGWLR